MDLDLPKLSTTKVVHDLNNLPVVQIMYYKKKFFNTIP